MSEPKLKDLIKALEEEILTEPKIKDMMQRYLNIIDKLREQYGDSDDFSRESVIEAFEGLENMEAMALGWFQHNSGYGYFVLFATAVDLGFRIGYHTAKRRRRKHD